MGIRCSSLPSHIMSLALETICAKVLISSGSRFPSSLYSGSGVPDSLDSRCGFVLSRNASATGLRGNIPFLVAQRLLTRACRPIRLTLAQHPREIVPRLQRTHCPLAHEDSV